RPCPRLFARSHLSHLSEFRCYPRRYLQPYWPSLPASATHGASHVWARGPQAPVDRAWGPHASGGGRGRRGGGQAGGGRVVEARAGWGWGWAGQLAAAFGQPEELGDQGIAAC